MSRTSRCAGRCRRSKDSSSAASSTSSSGQRRMVVCHLRAAASGSTSGEISRDRSFLYIGKTGVLGRKMSVFGVKTGGKGSHGASSDKANPPPLRTVPVGPAADIFRPAASGNPEGRHLSPIAKPLIPNAISKVADRTTFMRSVPSSAFQSAARCQDCHCQDCQNTPAHTPYSI